jgi:hypothetical protein
VGFLIINFMNFLDLHEKNILGYKIKLT